MITGGGGGSIPPITPDNAIPYLIAMIIVVGIIYFGAKTFMD